MTLNDEIMCLRDKLHQSIKDNDNFDVIYDLSTKLDVLIVTYYSKYKDLCKRKDKMC
ncbi:hypothetical protein CLPU_1c00950 [Gottschalkia purinilytica]|uniref:Spo0E like sporulation regulatory protein n=1 Tax=Gottschalkia purinilytica TaxID=1503 RepID=A0A0L0WER5_GOTPU|nr:aspartyl-phosphate phosphatase Spo0E family protein [Gottschalkia purinilytica]KNF09930.1 hypothetical protein CLPU_1c00950 [Gottschalkia purinilytica]